MRHFYIYMVTHFDDFACCRPSIAFLFVQQIHSPVRLISRGYIVISSYHIHSYPIGSMVLVYIYICANIWGISMGSMLPYIAAPWIRHGYLVFQWWQPVVQIENRRVLGILGLDAPPVENGNIPEVWLELCWKKHNIWGIWVTIWWEFNQQKLEYKSGWWFSHLPLWKMMEWKSVGIIPFPTEWKVIKFHGSSHHQPDMYKWGLFQPCCHGGLWWPMQVWVPEIQSPMISIGSMYGIYGNIYHQYTPNVSIYIYIPAPWILWAMIETLQKRSADPPLQPATSKTIVLETAQTRKPSESITE